MLFWCKPSEGAWRHYILNGIGTVLICIDSMGCPTSYIRRQDPDGNITSKACFRSPSLMVPCLIHRRRNTLMVQNAPNNTVGKLLATERTIALKNCITDTLESPQFDQGEQTRPTIRCIARYDKTHNKTQHHTVKYSKI